jgi:hypothetical protein
MITPTTVPQPVQLTAKVNAADLATLIGAVASANVIALPEGKTLADVTRLSVNVIPSPVLDGTVAIINASIK